MRKSIRCKDCQIKSSAVSVLSSNELDILEGSCVEVKLMAGELIIKEGSPSGHIIYLKEGLAKIHMKGPGDRDQILKIAKPGAYIGIQTILGDVVNHYSATALKDTNACFINLNIFKELIRKNGDFAYELMVYICKEELSYFHRFVNLSQKQINGRLADAILYFGEEIYQNMSFECALTKADIGALIGTSRGSVTLTLSSTLKNLFYLIEYFIHLNFTYINNFRMLQIPVTNHFPDQGFSYR